MEFIVSIAKFNNLEEKNALTCTLKTWQYYENILQLSVCEFNLNYH